MSNNESSNPDVKMDTAQADGVNETAQDTKVASNDTIPRARLNEEIAKRKELDSRLQEFEKAKEIEAQKKLEEEGEQKTILANKDAEIEKYKASHNELDAWKKTMRDEVLSTMSDEDKENFGDLPLDKLRKVSKRINIEKSVPPVDDGKPTSRGFASQGVGDFSEQSKGLSPKQRQGKWTEFQKTQK